MATSNRSAQFTKLHKVLKKHYQPVASDLERPVLEQFLFACCLENAHYDKAEEAHAALEHTFFDLNEVRVTTISELAEVLAGLPDPRAAGNRVKRILQGVFEEFYAFDLEDLRKKNLGPTVKWLSELDGASKFSVSYVVQSSLGGHSIPVDAGTLTALHIVGLVSDKDYKIGNVTGMERAIPKSKGIEFGSLLHQLGADFTANPYAPTIRKILLEINPDCKDNLPKRRAKKDAAKPAKKKAASEKTTAKTPSRKKAAPKKAPASRKGASKKGTPKKAKKAPTTKKPSPKKKSAQTKSTGPKAKPASSKLAKRKPR